MKISQLRHFVAVAEELHFVRAAEKLGISRRKLDSSVEAVEFDLGRPLFEPGASTTTLTAAGRQRLAQARAELAALGDEPEAAPSAGGKAKASKGTGRAPIVKGQPKPYKRRQSR
ncbi:MULTISPECIES: LysR family transcriptional regulator [unclassified Rathayibacter]|uniref:LysR family transcriptional regulator n=1 Tax=unclassified Rathayibacter TaxID=2609250 RepID=UPI00188B6F1F|nr:MULTISPECIES: LysR family transcriptional regulator [unclassified Rathayibacter]MBF4462108.1 LysR family transcriptional regulator [Rathayibacter sp. VKM Ac-2879]MBF4503849.1 LysR family transcriptional regulator [Rathayibacter sp. VKM Ac-2878]